MNYKPPRQRRYQTKGGSGYIPPLHRREQKEDVSQGTSSNSVYSPEDIKAMLQNGFGSFADGSTRDNRLEAIQSGKVNPLSPEPTNPLGFTAPFYQGPSYLDVLKENSEKQPEFVPTSQYDPKYLKPLPPIEPPRKYSDREKLFASFANFVNAGGETVADWLSIGNQTGDEFIKWLQETTEGQGGVLEAYADKDPLELAKMFIDNPFSEANTEYLEGKSLWERLSAPFVDDEFKALQSKIWSDAIEGVPDRTFDHPWEDFNRETARATYDYAQEVGGDILDEINETGYQAGRMMPSAVMGFGLSGLATPDQAFVGVGNMTDEAAIKAQDLMIKLLRVLPLGLAKAGGTMNRLDEEGIDFWTRSQVGTAHGLNEMASELLPFDYASEVLKQLKTTGLAQMGMQTFTAWATGVIAEGLQEVAVSPLDNMVTKFMYDPSQQIFDASEAGQDFMGGVGLALFFTALGLPVSTASHTNAVKMMNGEMEANMALLKQLIEIDTGMTIELNFGPQDFMNTADEQYEKGLLDIDAAEENPNLQVYEQKQQQKAAEERLQQKLEGTQDVSPYDYDAQLYNTIFGSAELNPNFKAEETQPEQPQVEQPKVEQPKVEEPEQVKTKPSTPISSDKVYYHGSSYSFDNFDVNKIRAGETDAYYNGIWFSDDINTLPAWTKEKETRAVKIHAKNTAPMDVVQKVVNQAQNLQKQNGEAFDKLLEQYNARSIQDLIRYKLLEMGYDTIVHDTKPTVNMDEFNETGETKVTTQRGTEYLLKRTEDGYVDLYYANNLNEGAITGYDSVDDFLSQQEENIVVLDPSIIENVDVKPYDQRRELLPKDDSHDPGQTEDTTQVIEEPESALFTPLEEGQNSKTKATIWNFAPKKKLPREQWKAILDKVKELGGSYYNKNFYFTTDSEQEALYKYQEVVTAEYDVAAKPTEPDTTPSKYESFQALLNDVYGNDFYDRQTLVSAYQYVTHTPEERALYFEKATQDRVVNIVEQVQEVTTGEQATNIALRELEKYIEMTKAYGNKVIELQSKIASPVVVGPAKFPKVRIEKAQKALDRKNGEWDDWENKTLKKIKTMVQNAAVEETTEIVEEQEQTEPESKTNIEIYEADSKITASKLLPLSKKVVEIPKSLVANENEHVIFTSIIIDKGAIKQLDTRVKKIVDTRETKDIEPFSYDVTNVYDKLYHDDTEAFIPLYMSKYTNFNIVAGHVEGSDTLIYVQKGYFDFFDKYDVDVRVKKNEQSENNMLYLFKDDEQVGILLKVRPHKSTVAEYEAYHKLPPQEEVVEVEEQTSETTDIENEVQEVQEIAEEIKTPQIDDKKVEKTDTMTVETETKGDVTKTVVKIEDFGEKIGGAKKDQWRVRNMIADDIEGMNEREMESVVLKKHIFKDINYEQMVNDGIPAYVVFGIKTIKDSLPAKPTKMRTGTTLEQYKKDRKNYVKAIELVRDKLLDVRNENDLLKLDHEVYQTTGIMAYDTSYVGTLRTLAWTDMGREQYYYLGTKKILNALNVRSYDLNKYKHKVKKTDFPKKVEAWRRNIRITKFHSGDYGVVNDKTNGIYAADFETYDEAQRYMETVLKPELSTKTKRTKPEIPHLAKLTINTVSHLDGKDAKEQDFLDVFHFKGGEFGNWVNQEERQQVMNMAYDALYDFADLLGIAPHSVTFDKVLSLAFGARGSGRALAHYESARKVINLTKLKGAGSLAHEWFHAFDDYIAMASSKQDPSTIFATKGLAASSELSKEMIDAVNNFVKVMRSTDITRAEAIEKAEGRISIKKRGVERLAKPYRDAMLEKAKSDQERKAINDAYDELLRNASESYSSRYTTFASLHKDLTGKVIPKFEGQQIENMVMYLGFAHSRLTDIEFIEDGDYGVRKSDYLEEAENIQGKGKEYWTAKHEMAARAFSAFVQDMLPAKNQYLVHSAKNGNPAYTEYKPFPEGQERVAINKAIAHLIDVAKQDGLLKSVGEGTYHQALESQIKEAKSQVDNAIAFNLELPDGTIPEVRELLDDIEVQGLQKEFEPELKQIIKHAKDINMVPDDSQIKVSFKELKKIADKAQTKLDKMTARLQKEKEKRQFAVRNTKEEMQQKELFRKEKRQATEERHKAKAEEKKEAAKGRKSRAALEKEALKTLRELSKSARKMRPHFKEAALEIIAAIDLRARKMNSKTEISLANTRAFFKALQHEAEEQGLTYEIPEEIAARIERLDKMQIAELDDTNLHALMDIARNIMHQNKTAFKMIGLARTRWAYEITDDFNAQVPSVRPEFYKDLENKKVLHALFGLNMLPPEMAVKMFVNFNTDTMFYTEIWRQMIEGQRNKILMLQRSHDMIEGKLEELGLDIKDMVGKKAKFKMFRTEGGKVYFNRGELISLYLSSLSKDNMRHITHGGLSTVSKGNVMARPKKLSKKDVQRVLLDLTPEEREFGNAVHEYFNRYQKEEINKASLQLIGYELADTPDYFPIITDSNYRNKKFDNFVNYASIENVGSTKDRVKAKNAIVLEDVFTVVERSREQMSTYSQMGVSLRNMKTIMGMQSVRDSMRDRFGPHMERYFDKLWQDVEGVRLTHDDIDPMLMKVVRNYQKAILGLNAQSWLNQTASIEMASLKIDKKYLLKAKKTNHDYELMEKYSPIIWFRRQGYITRESGDIAKHRNEFDKKTDIFTKPIMFFDSLTIGTIWNAVELKLLEEGDYHERSDELYEAVARETEEIIYTTQPNYTVLQRPQVLRSESVATKLAFVFMTQRLQNYAMMSEAIQVRKQTGDNTMVNRTVAVMLASSLHITFIKALRHLWRGNDKELVDYIADFGGSLLSNAPFMGDFFNSLYYGRRYGNYHIDRLNTRILTDFMMGLGIMFSPNDKLKLLGRVKLLAESAAMVKGIPLKNARLEIEAAMRQAFPLLYYQYMKLYKKPSNRDLYDYLEWAIDLEDDAFIRQLIRDMKVRGITGNDVGASFRTRDANTEWVERVKRLLD